MSEIQRDPAIKLFGQTIQLLIPDDQPSNEEHPSTSLHKKPLREEHVEAKGENASSNQCADESVDPSTSSGPNEDPKTPNADKEISSTNNSKTEDPTETSNSEEKTELKKPDKILPCPRCNSMDTKFCYFNNYNVNQPRHFCKNCQRYWTAGGTMRNVPVGSGRRKNKSSSASHYRQIIVSEALLAARADGVHHQSVLTFGSDAPLCESMASVLNLAENIAEKSQNVAVNEFHGQEQKNVDDFPVVSSSAASNSTDKGENGNLKNFQGYPLQVPCFPAPSWPYGPHPWNSAQYRSPMAPSTPTAFGPSSFPIPFYPPPQYWGCTVPSSPWSMPWLTPQNPFPEQFMVPSSPSSPLGKHSRDGNMLTSSNSVKEQASEGKDQEMAVLIPKTLRINDPNEAAKSSIWSTLGIKNDSSTNSIKGGSLFKGFEPKGDQKNHFDEKSTVLHANPAALSRSCNFHESS